MRIKILLLCILCVSSLTIHSATTYSVSPGTTNCVSQESITVGRTLYRGITKVSASVSGNIVTFTVSPCLETGTFPVNTPFSVYYSTSSSLTSVLNGSLISTSPASPKTGSSKVSSYSFTHTLSHTSGSRSYSVTSLINSIETCTEVITISASTTQQSSDATLKSLSVSSGSLSPSFSSSTTSYSVSVANSISSITISASSNDSKASVSGTGSKSLSVGSNSFSITVTAENGSRKTYTVNVTRAAAQTVSLRLAGQMQFNATTLTTNEPYQFNTIIKNDGNSSWSGKFILKKTENGIESQVYPWTETVDAGSIKSLIWNYYTPTTSGTKQFKLYYQTNSTGEEIPVPVGSYSNPITVTINAPAASGDCNFSVTINEPYYTAACFLSLRGVIDGSGSGNPQTGNPLLRKHLAKIAFNGLYRLKNRTIPTSVPSDYFPTVYSDLSTQTSENTYYYQAAKALLYLEYGDGVAPFDRNKTKFHPDSAIVRVDVLKVLLEAFNIKPDLSSTATYSNQDIKDLKSNNPLKFGYIYKAYNFSIIDDINTFRPFANCSRGEAFLMLYHIMQKIEAGNITDPNPTETNYFQPINITLQNISLGLGLELGNFNHYTKTSFDIDGVVPLEFSHSYNSYTTELPDEFYGEFNAGQGKVFTYKPLGAGWSHPYHSFVTIVGDRMVVHWGGGSIHIYSSNGTNFVCESLGVYDAASIASNIVTIKTKSQIEYRFKRNSTVASGVLELYSIKDRNGNELTVNYENGVGNVSRIKSVSDGSRSLTFSYKSGTNLISQITDPLNRSIKFDYTLNPVLNDYLLTSFTDAKNQTTNYVYGTQSDAGKCKLLTKVQLPKGNYIENEYNANNRRLTKTVTGYNGAKTETTVNVSANYQTNALSSVVNVKRVNQTVAYTHTFNMNNSPTQITGNGLSITANYTDARVKNKALPTAVKTNSNDFQEIRYDERGNVLSVKEAVNNSTGRTRTISMAYNDTRNDMISYTDALGNVTSYEYDTKGNLIKVSAPEGVTTNIAVNAKGLITSITNPEGIKTEYNYNSYGNVSSTSIPALSLTSYTNYDNASRAISVSDFLNRENKFTYDNNDNLLTEVNALSHTTRYNYDANDNLTTITNAKNGVTSMNYDNATDWLTSVSFGGATKQYTYNADGTLKSYTKPDGVTTLSSTYDDLGRVTSDGVSTYVYDAKHRLSTITKDGKTLTLGYSGFNQLVSVDYNDFSNNRIAYYYDDNDNVSDIYYSTDKPVNYIYDHLNRIKTVRDWNNKTITYNYRKDSQLQSVSYPNGMTVAYTYDNAGRQTGKTVKRSNNTVIASYDFTLDKVGNIIRESKTEPYSDFSPANETINYTYNENNNRITKAGDVNFTINSNGNTTKRGNVNYTYDKLDKLTSDGSFTFEYDGMGNIRSNGSKRYRIDITSMGNVLAETDLSGNPTAYYIYGATGLEARILPNGDTEYYVSDYRGSVVAMVDASTSANITHKYQYDEFGKITQKQESDANPFQYVGKHGVMYANDNLYYMRARFYDPSIGRFLSEDPIWSTNLYPYADNNPIMGIDPRGLSAISDVASKAKDFVYEQVFNKSMDAIGSGLYSVIGDQGIDLLTDVGNGKYYLTEWVENSMKMYQGQYTQSVVNGKPNNLALVGYGITSMWTKDTYLTTAYTLASFGKVAGAVASNATNISTTVLGKTTGLGLVDMRTVLGRGIKATVNAYNVGKSTIAGIAAFDASMKNGNYYDALKKAFNLK